MDKGEFPFQDYKSLGERGLFVTSLLAGLNWVKKGDVYITLPT